MYVCVYCMQCRKYDPVRADKLARNDWYRMRRYLEIALSLRDAELAEDGGVGVSNPSVIHTYIHTYID